MTFLIETGRGRSLSRRHRRIAWTAATLAAITLIGGVVAWRIQKDNEPAEYTPGEASADVTSVVSDQAARKVTATLSMPRIETRARDVEPLRNPGHKLPRGAPEPRFTDVTKSAGLDSFRQFNGERTSQLPEDMGSGLAWGDFDNDGYDDLFAVSGGSALESTRSARAPSLLYHNLGDGRFEKVADFPDTRILGMGAAWADYDNDGWLDLIVTGYDQILLFRNDHGRFVRVPFASPKGFWTGVSWGDFNRDGYPDVYICGYVKYIAGKGDPARSTQQFGLEVPFTLNPASYEPQRNLLFRNDGHGRFTEVARELGVADESGRSLSALWHDFDGDGWPDLYVANDISENKLYLNRRGKFIDAGRQAWVEEYRGSMGLAAGDFDRDGDDDLFISHWIAQQFALYQNLLSEQRQTGGADSPLHFTDVAEMQGIGQPSMQSIGWGASFVDFDSDGWPDLAVANGSTFEDKTKSRRPLSPMPSLLFWNAHGQFFYDVAPWNRSFSTPHVSRGFAVADYDNDGSMDMAIVDHGEGVRLLRNDVPHGNWIELRLHSRPPGAGAPIGFADGATVIAWVGGVPLRRTVGSASYLSQDTRRVHIGLGAARTVDRVEVRWLNGKAETWSHLEANHIWDISEGAREPHLFAPGTRSADLPPVPGQSRVARFWEIQRAAMDAMKRQHDFAKASQLFREALAIDPAHEDAEYYLANCLAEQDDVPAAVAELDKLIALNPQSHRALQRKGELLAASARSRTQLQAARASIEAALRLNSEETGALLLLGEIELGLGDMAGAERTLAHVCQANQRAASAWFLRGYVAWKRRDLRRAAEMLTVSRAALGAESKPAGAVLEGDVKRRMLRESGFLNVFMQSWDGSAAPSRAYNGLDQYLQQFR